ncbi:GMC family oxidoreductase N-terminal domain-containing protein [Caballeronia sp. LZ035]|uniref:GMC family oxidoreductase n=1 Tax=Caballeronia sp. LZ035 TaxID=3038568 RepID=UPI002855911C|nr:GMC family oxidoreductase N-terminal domain-containing protein [Caballeronia sp. LZ035]MDR5760715.1 GMC family oxidoreductase N-terminal domain-containing protein [Caballeronia sp. LZ035]
METYDYVVIGGGTAGCIIANRLSQSGKHRVLILEGGPDDKKLWTRFVVGVSKTITDPDVNWCLKSEPESNAHGRRLAVPLGRVLGGSSAINGGVYVRGSRADYDRWAQKGCTGWSYADVLPYFKRAERFQRGASEYRGGDGPLGVSDNYESDKLIDAFIASAQAVGHRCNPDFNAHSQDGFNYSQTTTYKGWRHSTARAYLKPVQDRRNLTVVTGALASRIVFENRRAVAVEYRQEGASVTVRAAKEIILCAGAIHSPALLERSGVGQAERLAALGIPLVHDAREVGENLQDHFAAWTRWRVKGHATLNQRTRGWRAVLEALKFALFRTGALTYPACPAMGFARTRDTEEHCDVQLFAAPLSFSDPATRKLDRHPGMTISVMGLRPASRGSVHRESADPAASPVVRYNAFSVEDDARVIADGIKIARSVMLAGPLRVFEPVETAPGAAVSSDAELLDFVRQAGNTCYHPCGTCRMGADDDAVVDPRLRVNGVEGLRVADNSIMPEVVSGNTNATAIMIGEKASDLILADA